MRLSLESLLPSVSHGWKNMYTECGLRTCPNTLFMRSVQSRVGINVGPAWYCSPDCLAAAATMRFSAFTVSNILEMPHSPRLSIGLVMLSKGYVTDQQLRLAISESQRSGEELESVLFRLGLASERQMTAARAAQWGYPVLGQERMTQVADLDVPTTLLESCSAAALHSSIAAKRLLLGFVHRVDHSLMNSVEEMTGFRAEPCFITPTELAEQRARLTAVPRCEEVVIEDLKTSAQMGRAVAGLTVEIGAREVRFSHCRDYAWTRLTGKRRMIDVLFRIKSERNSGRENVPVSERARSAG